MKRPINSAFGNTILLRRRALEMTQLSLSEKCGVHETTISKLERGIASPSLNVIMKLAEALDCQAGDLMPIRGE